MSSDASAVLGAQEIAGSFVSQKGLTKEITGQTAARLVAGAAGTIAASGLADDGAAPDFGNTGYVAVTASEVAIVKAKSGLMKPKVGDAVVARMPRDQITNVELGTHMLTAGLTITFASGQSWSFEVPRVFRSSAERVVQALGGRAA
jgi:hypothetical protein